jgi:hypothetical protein
MKRNRGFTMDGQRSGAQISMAFICTNCGLSGNMKKIIRVVRVGPHSEF